MIILVFKTIALYKHYNNIKNMIIYYIYISLLSYNNESYFMHYTDTSGAQAVLEAHGGVLSKLTTFRNKQELSSYTYLRSTTGLNLDFEENKANLTPYNAANKKAVKKGDAPRRGKHEEFASYSNLCGLLAVNAVGMEKLPEFYTAIQVAKTIAEPAYD